MSGYGLVLAGGGGKGAYHIGVWKALKEYGADKNIISVSGTSVGALNAILFAQGNYEKAEEVWMSISQDDILKVDIKKLAIELVAMGILTGNTYMSIKSIAGFYGMTKAGGSGFFSKEGLSDIIDKYINVYDVNNNLKSVYAAAYNLSKLDIDYLKMNGNSKEDIKNILLASTALPIIFDSQKINGDTYIDGGVKDNIPIKPLYDEGIRTFLVVHLSRDSVIDKDQFKDARIIEIVPNKDQGDLISGTLDFSPEGSRRRIKQGYEDTKRILKPLYEMGIINLKINETLNIMKNDNIRFEKEKSNIRKERENLKAQIDELLR